MKLVPPVLGKLLTVIAVRVFTMTASAFNPQTSEPYETATLNPYITNALAPLQATLLSEIQKLLWQDDLPIRTRALLSNVPIPPCPIIVTGIPSIDALPTEIELKKAGS
jgi:hypothetical protein